MTIGIQTDKTEVETTIGWHTTTITNAIFSHNVATKLYVGLHFLHGLRVCLGFENISLGFVI